MVGTPLPWCQGKPGWQKGVFLRNEPTVFGAKLCVEVSIGQYVADFQNANFRWVRFHQNGFGRVCLRRFWALKQRENTLFLGNEAKLAEAGADIYG
ncbi:MAG: hypothetical protein ABSA12_01230 [Verrucomicrobiia bacterium]|jgi:hypothetical protein